MKKKKILLHSNHSRAFTGFGKNAKNILIHLHKTGKYEIIELANGIQYGDPNLDLLPWKAIGTLPNDPRRIEAINRDPNLARGAGYGAEMIDEIIKKEKPDIYIGAEDIWAFDGFFNKLWWNKINCMVWTTLDSLPLLPTAIDNAEKIKNYYVWASFAEKELKRLGKPHVKTLRGCVDTGKFFRLSNEKKQRIRAEQKVPYSSFVIGFVFRNQLRKSVPNLLDGFKLFTQQHPEANAKLLLHTHWSEGWDIPRLLKEKNIDNNTVITAYFCKKCRKYEIKPFAGQDLNCRFCGGEKTQQTTQVSLGVSDTQLNEIYNLMNVYCHPFTSGGQELPIQEAKLSELITLVTNYSCGEDSCTKESAGRPLEWAEYREPGTQFIKASTSPGSIRSQLSKVFKMPEDKKRKEEAKAREYVVRNYSIETIGQQIEAMLDEMEPTNWDFDFEEKKRNPDYVAPEISDNSAWLIDIYANILNIEISSVDDHGHKYWMAEFAKGASRDHVLNYFKSVAVKENQNLNKIDVREVFKNSEKSALFILNGKMSDVFNATSLFKSFKETYPDHDLYFSCPQHYSDILNGNPYVTKFIPFQPELENEISLIGYADNKPVVDFYCVLNTSTDKAVNYISNPNRALELAL